MKPDLCFLHGLDSSPHGTKARLLRQHYPEIWIPDLPPDIYLRMEILEKEFPGPMTVIGSSLGGLSAVMYAMRHPEMVRGMVLMAPALGVREDLIFSPDDRRKLGTLFFPEGIPAVVIAGLKDTLIPLSSIAEAIKRSPDPERISLRVMDDDHNLHGSLDRMLEAVAEVLSLSR
jgi:pimeloyl-ACP methyl ester carboxylesterase